MHTMHCTLRLFDIKISSCVLFSTVKNNINVSRQLTCIMYFVLFS